MSLQRPVRLNNPPDLFRLPDLGTTVNHCGIRRRPGDKRWVTGFNVRESRVDGEIHGGHSVSR